MAIQYPDSYFLGANLINPRVYYKTVKALIDAVNKLTLGQLDSITPPSGTLTVVGSLTTSGGGLTIPTGQTIRTDTINSTNGTNAISISPNIVLGKAVVTQATNITTAVTINSGSGVITTVALTTAAGAISGPFTVTNSKVLSTSVVLATVEYAAGLTGVPVVNVEGVTTGSFKLKIGNGGSAALNGLVKIHFVVF